MWAYCSYITKDGKEISEPERVDRIIHRGISFDFTRFMQWESRNFAFLICHYDHESRSTSIFPCLTLTDKSLEDAEHLMKDFVLRSYCDISENTKDLHYLKPFFWNDVIETIASRVDFKGFFEYISSSKPVGNSYGFAVKFKYQYDTPITFIRSIENKHLLFSTISKSLEDMITKIVMDFTVCRELYKSPLGEVLSGVSWLSPIHQKIAMRHHKWWLQRIKSSKEGDISPQVYQDEIAIFNQVKKSLSFGGSAFGSKHKRSLSASNITLKWGYNPNVRGYGFMGSFCGAQISDIPDFIRLLKLTETYNEVFDLCSKYILSRA